MTQDSIFLGGPSVSTGLGNNARQINSKWNKSLNLIRICTTFYFIQEQIFICITRVWLHHSPGDLYENHSGRHVFVLSHPVSQDVVSWWPAEVSNTEQSETFLLQQSKRLKNNIFYHLTFSLVKEHKQYIQELKFRTIFIYFIE